MSIFGLCFSHDAAAVVSDSNSIKIEREIGVTKLESLRQAGRIVSLHSSCWTLEDLSHRRLIETFSNLDQPFQKAHTLSVCPLPLPLGFDREEMLCLDFQPGIWPLSLHDTHSGD